MGGKFKLFIENFLIYGLGSIISSVIPFLMLPVITRLLKDTYYYGINDMFNVIVSFGSSLAVMGMFDAMFRMFFDKETVEYKRRVCSSALACVLSSGLVVFLVLVLFRSYFAGLFFNSESFSVLLCVCAVTIYFRSLLSIVSAPTRMENKRKVFIAVNTVSPLIGYAISIPMILRGNLLFALPLAGMISSAITVVIFTALNYRWFSLERVELKIIKQLIVIGIPLLPTFLFYWIFSSFDRIMISKMMGTSFVGIYGVGAKVAGISQFIYLAFGGGWNYFTFSTMKDHDHTMTVSNIYEYLGVVSFACTIILTSISKLIFGLLFSGDYVYGSIAFPYLFLSPLVTLLFQVAGSQFVVIKKTWPASFILSLGAVVNVSLAYLLIPLMGIEGAALGVLTGYSAAAAGISLLAVKMGLLKINRRFLFSAVTTCVYMLMHRIFLNVWLIPSLAAGLGAVLWFAAMYKKDIAMLINRINTKNLGTDKGMIGGRPLVSVVLSAYNHEKYVGECIESIIGQSYRNIELIILNDGSRDKTEEVIKRYRKACEKRCIRFIFINKGNEGLCKTANKGISMALGKYIVPFASDDIMLPFNVECSIKPMEEDDSVGMTFSNGYRFADNSGKLKPFYKGSRKVKDGYIFQDLLRKNYLFAPSFCIRREAYDRVGGYNEKYSFEDYDMSLRISLKYKVKYVPYYLVKYRIHDASLSCRNDTQLNILLEHMGIIQRYRNLMRNKDFEHAEKDINRRILNCHFMGGNIEGFNQYFKKYRAGGGMSPVILVKKIWISLGIDTRYYYKIKRLLKRWH